MARIYRKYAVHVEEYMFTQLQPQKYYMQIARQIKNSIFSGELKPGDQLPPERMLAEEFNSSRACIREAFSALEMLGLIECRGRQGNYVSRKASEEMIDQNLLRSLLTGHDPLDIVEARLEIEPAITALAAHRCTSKEIVLLKKSLDKLEACADLIDSGDQGAVEAYMEEERQFHVNISRFCHNSVLHSVYSSVAYMMRETHWKALMAETLTRPECVGLYLKAYTVLLGALEEHEPEQAREAMRDHLARIKEDMF